MKTSVALGIVSLDIEVKEVVSHITLGHFGVYAYQTVEEQEQTLRLKLVQRSKPAGEEPSCWIPLPRKPDLVIENPQGLTKDELTVVVTDWLDEVKPLVERMNIRYTFFTNVVLAHLFRISGGEITLNLPRLFAQPDQPAKSFWRQ